jgi:hypothetical protein
MPHTFNRLMRWIVPGLGAIAVAGLVLYWQWPSVIELSRSQAAGAKQPTPVEPARASRDVVRLNTHRDNDSAIVELRIAPHWHINANPSSLAFLIPTKIQIKADGQAIPIRLRYPAGQEIDVGLEQPIAVYSGRLVLKVHLLDQMASRTADLSARVQACNDTGRCLPPSTLSSRLSVPGP